MWWTAWKRLSESPKIHYTAPCNNLAAPEFHQSASRPGFFCPIALVAMSCNRYSKKNTVIFTSFSISVYMVHDRCLDCGLAGHFAGSHLCVQAQQGVRAKAAASSSSSSAASTLHFTRRCQRLWRPFQRRPSYLRLLRMLPNLRLLRKPRLLGSMSHPIWTGSSTAGSPENGSATTTTGGSL